MVHVDYAVIDGCKNLEESYGEICVQCNKCGRFSCDKCRYQKKLVKYDYSQGGCIHTEQEGFACLAPEIVSEGQVTWMVGQEGKDGCECFKERKR